MQRHTCYTFECQHFHHFHQCSNRPTWPWNCCMQNTDLLLYTLQQVWIHTVYKSGNKGSSIWKKKGRMPHPSLCVARSMTEAVGRVKWQTGSLLGRDHEHVAASVGTSAWWSPRQHQQCHRSLHTSQQHAVNNWCTLSWVKGHGCPATTSQCQCTTNASQNKPIHNDNDQFNKWLQQSKSVVSYNTYKYKHIADSLGSEHTTDCLFTSLGTRELSPNWHCACILQSAFGLLFTGLSCRHHTVYMLYCTETVQLTPLST